jgi:hypothetical protein
LNQRFFREYSCVRALPFGMFPTPDPPTGQELVDDALQRQSSPAMQRIPLPAAAFVAAEAERNPRIRVPLVARLSPMHRARAKVVSEVDALMCHGLLLSARLHNFSPPSLPLAAFLIKLAALFVKTPPSCRVPSC